MHGQKTGRSLHHRPVFAHPDPPQAAGRKPKNHDTRRAAAQTRRQRILGTESIHTSRRIQLCSKRAPRWETGLHRHLQTPQAHSDGAERHDANSSGHSSLSADIRFFKPGIPFPDRSSSFILSARCQTLGSLENKLIHISKKARSLPPALNRFATQAGYKKDEVCCRKIASFKPGQRTSLRRLLPSLQQPDGERIHLSRESTARGGRAYAEMALAQKKKQQQQQQRYRASRDTEPAEIPSQQRHRASKDTEPAKTPSSGDTKPAERPSQQRDQADRETKPAERVKRARETTRARDSASRATVQAVPHGYTITTPANEGKNSTASFLARQNSLDTFGQPAYKKNGMKCRTSSSRNKDFVDSIAESARGTLSSQAAYVRAPSTAAMAHRRRLRREATNTTSDLYPILRK
ncbi:hypothetical protein IQ07DRAFT_603561 [Pyrenochaeta sp. DS3sAY3a]|nr:hypothetical protein IQ07DRAFT_603561 [Pyrenochaeta sp. DS3sAY3a]